MSSSIENAEAYFQPTNHLRAATWARFSEEQKLAAIAQAKRILNRACSVADIETELDTDDVVGMNPEYAIYEQALYMLVNLPMVNADETLSIPEAADPESPDKARKSDRALIAPEAMAWLVTQGGVTLTRG